MSRRALIPVNVDVVLEPGSPRARTLARRVLDAWIKDSPTGSTNTRDAKTRDLRAYARYRGIADGPQQLVEITEQLLFHGFADAHEAVRSWLAWMAEKVTRDGRQRPRRAPSTRARRLAHLRSLVRMAQEFGLPWALQIRGPRIKPFRDASGPEAWRVYAVIADLAADPSDGAARDGAILHLLFVLGLRRQSVADLRLEDIRGAELWIRSKGDEELRRRSVPSATQGAVARWIGRRGSWEGPLFTGVRRNERRRGLSAGQIWRICRGYGIGHPHGLRHSGATKLAREGHSAWQLQDHLDHASAMTCQHYVDASEDAQGQVAAYLAEQLEGLYDRDDEAGSRSDPPDG